MPQEEVKECYYPHIEKVQQIRDKIDAIVSANKEAIKDTTLSRKAEGVLQERLLCEDFDTSYLYLFYNLDEQKRTFTSRNLTVNVINFQPNSFIEFLQKPIIGIKYAKAERNYSNPDVTPEFIFNTIEKLITLKYNGVHEYGNQLLYVFNGLDKSFLEAKESDNDFRVFRLSGHGREIMFVSSNTTLTHFYMSIVQSLQPKSALSVLNIFQAGDIYYWATKLVDKDAHKQAVANISTVLKKTGNSLKKLLELVFSPTFDHKMASKESFSSIKLSIGMLLAEKVIQKHGIQVMNRIVEEMSDVESYFEFISGRKKLEVLDMDYFTFVGYLQRIIETEMREHLAV